MPWQQHVIKIADPKIIVAEQFRTDNITITLEWAKENSLYSYNITVLPYLLLQLNSSEIYTNVRFEVQYNTVYNVSILVTPPCGQDNLSMIHSFELYYGRYFLLHHRSMSFT